MTKKTQYQFAISISEDSEVDKDLIAFAKWLANEDNRSLSSLVKTWLLREMSKVIIQKEDSRTTFVRIANGRQ